jgi:hypothetical protein
MNAIEDAEQPKTWIALYRRILRTLQKFGVEDHFGHADYLLVDDNYGSRRHTIEIHKLRMLDPTLVKQLRSLLHDLDGWEIVISVDIPEAEDRWPPMGLIIRKHELIDGLQRQYLPSEFKSILFEGSRPGTGFD